MRIEQVDSLIHNELAAIVNREIGDGEFLVTITYVETAQNLASANIGVSVLPEKFTGTALEKLRKNSSFFNKMLLKKTRLRKIPRFQWMIDNTEKKASELEDLLNQIKENNL
jgi:ribosome-binding factor A